MDKIADWLKQSKGAPLVASLLILMLMTNTIFDFILKAPAVFQKSQEQVSPVGGQVQTTLISLVTTLRSTNEILQEMTTTQGKMLISLNNMKLSIEDVHARQVTRSEFNSELGDLKKKLEHIQK